MTIDQTELSFCAPVAEPDPNVPYLISILQGADWLTAREIGALVFARTNVRWCDRKIRELASHSGGRIAGGQRGYKLVELMTKEQFLHARNWMASQAAEMQRRVIQMDKVFYARKTVEITKLSLESI